MRKKNNLWTDLTEAQIQGLPHLSQIHTRDTLFHPRFIPAIPPYCNPICTTRNLAKKNPQDKIKIQRSSKNDSTFLNI